jgi:hypothetical protein
MGVRWIVFSGQRGAVMLAKLQGAISFAYESFSTLYADELGERRQLSRRVRAEIRSEYFHSRSEIRNVTLSEYCSGLGGLDPWHTVTLPALCADGNLNVGSPQYFLALAAIACCLKPECIVEFGTYLGASALTFALNAPAARLVTIDLPNEPGDISNLPEVDKHHVKASRHRVGKWYQGTPHQARITELKCDSRKLDLSKHVQSADFVLVDGGHDLECITADTQNAFAVTRAGGAILWDDYFWLYPDVVRFLDTLSKTHELVSIQGTNLVAHVCR